MCSVVWCVNGRVCCCLYRSILNIKWMTNRIRANTTHTSDHWVHFESVCASELSECKCQCLVEPETDYSVAHIQRRAAIAVENKILRKVKKEREKRRRKTRKKKHTINATAVVRHSNKCKTLASQRKKNYLFIIIIYTDVCECIECLCARVSLVASHNFHRSVACIHNIHFFVFV